MNTYAKSLAALAVAVVFLASLPAQAVTVNFLSQVAGDGSGKTSPVGVDGSNTALPGFFLETFDTGVPGGTGTFALTNGGSYTVESSGGGLMSLNEATDLYVSGTFGIRTGSTSYAAAPAGDLTNYAFAPRNGGSTPVTVRVEFATDLNTYLAGLYISYLGLYYGSIDTYNNIAFYSDVVGGGNLLTGSGILSDGVITGTELLASQGGTSGDRFGVGSNVYVNLFFNPSEAFTAFELRTTGIAFETDNIVVGVSPVPEPATMLLLGLGLMGLAGVRRKFSN